MKLPHRRRFLRLAAGAAALTALSRAASAQAYPSRSVHLIVGYAPGGGNDIVARLTGQWLSERLGRPFIIDNRPLGGGNVGTEAAVRSRPDGYTLVLLGPPAAINATLYQSLPFDFLNDSSPVAGSMKLANVMDVNLPFPATNTRQPQR